MLTWFSVFLRLAADDDDILELPRALVPDNIPENSMIHVLALPYVQDAGMLHVEPLTVADWELLETRADFLEDGALLQQVSIVYSDQRIPLWVGANDVAWIRVLPTNFGGGESTESVWPKTAGEGSQGDIPSAAHAGCRRLVQDTRICVVPKPRNKNESLLSPPLRVYTTMADYLPPELEIAQSLGKCQPATTPGTVLVSSAMKTRIPGIQADDSSALVVLWDTANGSDPNAPSSSCVLRIGFCDDIPQLCIGKLTFHLSLNTLQGFLASPGRINTMLILKHYEVKTFNFKSEARAPISMFFRCFHITTT